MLIDRKEEQKIILTFISHILNGQSWLLLITGSTGMGKTTMLRWAQKEAEKQKAIVVFVNAPRRAVKEQILAELKAGITGLLKELEDNEEIKKDSAKNFAKTDIADFTHLAKAAKKAVWERATLFIINDLDKAKNAQKIIEELNDATENNGGIGIIASSSKRLVPSLGNMMINLKSVEEQDFFDYVSKVTKETIKMGDECARAIYRDSGGNPRVLQFVSWYLYENMRETDKIVTQAHYTGSRRAILAALGNEWFGQLYADASEEEKKILKALAKVNEMNVTELARAIGKKEGPTATLLLRLVERGDVVKVRRGVYKLFAPLYAHFISER